MNSFGHSSSSDILCCPCCHSRLIIASSDYHCPNNLCSLSRFPSINKKPILFNINSPFSLFTFDDVPTSYVPRRSPLPHSIQSLLDRRSTTYAQLLDPLRSLSRGSRVLIVGGGSKGNGTSELYRLASNGFIELLSIDIYDSPNVTLIADAHSLPFPHDTFDFVLIQAVLEHVISPAAVASEIYRVLKPSGYLYSEVPFLQSIHEGAYDFTRYTLSGHVLLFSDFTTLSYGSLDGPFATLLFIISHVLQLFVGKNCRRVFYHLFYFPFFFLDFILPEKMKVDVCSGSYVLARKPLSHSDLQHTSQQRLKQLYKGLQ